MDIPLFLIFRYTTAMNRQYSFIIVGAVVIGLVIWFTWPTKKTMAPTVNSSNTALVHVDQPTNIPSTMILFSTADVPDRDPAFEFTLVIPKQWRVEYLAGVKAMNFYDPAGVKTGTSLEQSQLIVQASTGIATDVPSGFSKKEISTMTNAGVRVTEETLTATAAAKKQTGLPAFMSATHPVAVFESTSGTSTIRYLASRHPNVDDPTWQSIVSSLKFN